MQSVRLESALLLIAAVCVKLRLHFLALYGQSWAHCKRAVLRLEEILFCLPVPPGLLPQLLQARQFKCPHCKATQALPDTLQPVRQPGGYLHESNSGMLQHVRAILLVRSICICCAVPLLVVVASDALVRQARRKV